MDFYSVHLAHFSLFYIPKLQVSLLTWDLKLQRDIIVKSITHVYQHDQMYRHLVAIYQNTRLHREPPSGLIPVKLTSCLLLTRT